jgi:hypothetical protein
MIGMYNYVVFFIGVHNWFAFDVKFFSQTLSQISFSIILEHMPFDTKTQVEDLNTVKYLIEGFWHVHSFKIVFPS